MSSPTLLTTEQPGDHIRPLKIAVEGCGHGALDLIYESLATACQARNWTLSDLDFLIICGDFQALCNSNDLPSLAAPPRYQSLGSFPTYYNGTAHAPVLTLVIGGNHECTTYMSSLHHGGWLAPSIYYLGSASVLRYGPYRIAGLSGIYKAGDYMKPRVERMPFSRSDVRSICHVRHVDVEKLLRVKGQVDIGLSHDWPGNVEWGGDAKALFAKKPHFFESVLDGRFGSEPAEKVLRRLRPGYWFSGHMHTRFSAMIEHEAFPPKECLERLDVSGKVRGQLQRAMARRKKILSGEGDVPEGVTNKVTRFLALDKPGPGREFLELLEIESLCTARGAEDGEARQYMQKTPEGKFSLHYDEEWLSIVRASGDVLEEETRETRPHDSDAEHEDELSCHLRWVQENVTAKGLLKIPENFERHASIDDPENPLEHDEQPREYPNSQTEQFCRMLGIRDKFSDDREEVVAEKEVAEEDEFVVFE